MATANAIRNTRKPVTAYVSNMAASAAYWLASQADEISAQNAMTRVGSIGTVQTLLVNPSVKQITSSNAPKKRPDVTTEAGVKTVVEHLDDVEALFIADVAAGRSVTEKKVKSDFGQGGLLLAEEAKSVGMIDTISEGATGVPAAASTQTQAASSGDVKQESKNMDLKTLKAEHPSVFAEAVAVGVEEERNRCQAHLKLASSSGNTEYAFECIRDGVGMNALVQAEHMAAAMSKLNIAAAQADEAEVAAAADAANSAETDNVEAKDVEEEVHEAAIHELGVEVSDDE